MSLPRHDLAGYNGLRMTWSSWRWYERRELQPTRSALDRFFRRAEWGHEAILSGP